MKIYKGTVYDGALGVWKKGAEEAGVTEVRTSLSAKKFDLCFVSSIRRQTRSSTVSWARRCVEETGAVRRVIAVAIRAVPFGAARGGLCCLVQGLPLIHS